jgi:hypothetical protein
VNLTAHFVPFCSIWIPKVDWQKHIHTHKSGNFISVPWISGIIEVPETLEELKSRFHPIGLYEER